MRGFDTNQNCTAFAAGLAKQGYLFAGRYHRRSLTDPSRLTRQEAAALDFAGIALVSVFQHRSNRVEEFTLDNAKRDAEGALRAAEDVRQPTASAIYLAFDTDFTKANVAVALAYGEAWARLVKPEGYGTGCYGDKDVLELLTTTYRAGWGDLFDHRWQGNAKAWGVAGDWDICQRSLPKTVLPGLAIDECEAQGFIQAGMWRPAA